MPQTRYNTKSLADRVDQLGPEDGGVGKAGLYRHPESGQEMHTLSDPLFGEAQSNAAVRLGFVRVRDSRPDEIHNIALDSVTKAQGETDSLKGLSARMNQLEGVQEKNVALEKEIEAMRAKYESGAATDSPAVAQSVETAKNAAKANVKARGQGDTSEVEVPKASNAPGNTPAVQMDDGLPEDSASHLHPDSPRVGDEDEGDEGDEGDQDEPEKSLDKQNATELKTTAAREGVDVTDADTNAKLREAIQTHRDAAAKLKEESEQE